jgi:hypothetical protein
MRTAHAVSAPERLGDVWVLRCTCTWVSEPHKRAEQARAAGAEHVWQVMSAHASSEQQRVQRE